MKRLLGAGLIAGAMILLAACSATQIQTDLAAVNTDLTTIVGDVNQDVTVVAQAGLPALCKLAVALNTDYLVAAEVSSTVAAREATEQSVYAALTGSGGLCAPDAPAPANAVQAVALVVGQVQAIQAAIKPAVTATTSGAGS